MDSVHSQLYKILGGLNSTEAIKDGVNTDDTANAGLSNTKSGGGKRPTARQKPVETLLTGAKAAALFMTEADLCYEVDPMFFKMASAFDEGGAKGLMLNRLQVSGDLTIVFDSDAPLTRARANFHSAGTLFSKDGDLEMAEQAGEGKLEQEGRGEEKIADINICSDEDFLSSADFTALMVRVGEAAAGKQLCPLLTAFRNEIREAKAQIATLRGGNPDRTEAVSEDEEAVLDTEANREAHELSASLLFGGDGTASSEDGEDEMTGEAVIRKQNDISFTARDGEDGDGVGRSWELLGDAFLNWAGPSHWRKLKRARAADRAVDTNLMETAPSTAAVEGSRSAKREAESLIDFEALLSCAESLIAIEADEGVRRKRGLDAAINNCKNTENETKKTKSAEKRRNLAKNGADTANTLPVDMHLDAGLFVHPFYRPHLVGKHVTREVALSRGSLAAAAAKIAQEPEQLGLRWYNYDNPNDRRYCAELAAGGENAEEGSISSDAAEDAEANGLVGANVSGRYDEMALDEDGGLGLLAFSHMSRQVDVHKLKINLLRSLDCLMAKKVINSSSDAAGKGDGEREGAKVGEEGEDKEGTVSKDFGKNKGDCTQEADGEADNKSGRGRDAGTPNTEKLETVRFSSVVKEMRRANRSLEKVSVHYCFVSFLHLANERGMEMTPLALADFDVLRRSD